MKIKDFIKLNKKNKNTYYNSSFYEYFKERPKEKKFLKIILENDIEDYKINNVKTDKEINIENNFDLLLTGLDRATFHKDCIRYKNGQEFYIEYLNF